MNRCTLRCFVAGLLSALLVVSANTAQAVSTWNGGTDSLWSTAANWDAAPINGDALTFDGTANQINTNDLLSNIGLLTLNNAGWNITLGTLTLNGGIAANGASTLGGMS